MLIISKHGTGEDKYRIESNLKQLRDLSAKPVIPRILQIPGRMSFNSWLDLYYKYVEQIHAYIMHWLLHQETCNYIISYNKGKQAFIEELAYYIYTHSENAQKSYIFFK